jgi:hypothetical protein
LGFPAFRYGGGTESRNINSDTRLCPRTAQTSRKVRPNCHQIATKSEVFGVTRTLISHKNDRSSGIDPPISYRMDRPAMLGPHAGRIPATRAATRATSSGSGVRL